MATKRTAKTARSRPGLRAPLFFAASLAAIILVIAAVIAYAHPRTQSSGPPAAPSAPALIIGRRTAKVTIIEYGDFHCPSCEAFFRQVEPQIQANYIAPGLVKLEYRVFPWIGPDSVRAGEAAYCANDQGKFAQFHDALYEDQGAEHANVFTPAKLDQIASSLGLNVSRFNTCFNSGKYSSVASGGVAAAENNGIDATPTFFIGHQKIIGAQSYATFKTLINEAL